MEGAPEQLRALPGPIVHALLEVFARSYQAVYLWAIPFAIAALVLALMLQETPLRASAHLDGEEPGGLAGSR